MEEFEYEEDEDEINYRYDTQLLIEGKNLSDDAIRDYFNTQFVGDCLLVVGDDDVVFGPLQHLQRERGVVKEVELQVLVQPFHISGRHDL